MYIYCFVLHANYIVFMLKINHADSISVEDEYLSNKDMQGNVPS